MSEKRRDHKGRILKTGESQRKDLLYQYRYTDLNNKRKTIYDSDLKRLREKEKVIQRQLEDGINYINTKISVVDLVKKYTNLKKFAKKSTKENYTMIINLITAEAFGQRSIDEIKISDAKEWIIKLSNDGRKFNTINAICGVVKPAFQMAVDENLLYRNPFSFKLSEVIRRDAEERVALTKQEQFVLMDYISNDKMYKKNYDEFVILLGTGMRVSELCGLTINDLDFENRRIRVDHQLLKSWDGEYYIDTPKTTKGNRYIPMTPEVYMSFKNAIAKRSKPQEEFSINGYSGFVFLNKKGRPKTAIDIGSMMRNATKRFNRIYPDRQFPRISPHILRHTFCTNMAQSGMDLKALQYIMGHSNAQVTLNVYTHSDYTHAASQMDKMSNIIDITSLFQNKKLG